MGSVSRLRVALSGDIGGPGVLTMHAHNNAFTSLNTADANAWLGFVHTFLNSCATWLVNKVTYTFPSTVEDLDIPTEALLGLTTISSVPASVTGPGTGGYIAGTGFRVQWHTSNVRNRRLVRGASFITPIEQAVQTTAGQVDSTAAASVATAANNYLSSMAGANVVPCVYSRPRPVHAGNGALADIVGASVASQVASLRSRRS